MQKGVYIHWKVCIILIIESKHRESIIMTLSEARAEARTNNITIGKLTTSKDSQGEYTLKEDGFIVAEGYYDSASEIKADYISEKIYK